MKFYEVAFYFDQIAQEPSRLKMTQLLADLFKKASAQDAQIISYWSLGLMRAVYEPTFFGIAEKTMAKIISMVTGHEVKTIMAAAHKKGDLGSVLLEYHVQRADAALTVQQVYKELEHIEKISGEGSQEIKAERCAELLQKVDPLSAQFIVRIILNTLRLGFSDMTLIDSLSWLLLGNKSARESIEHAYNLCADIGLITHTVKIDGLAGLEKMHIQVGIPIRPAAAERLPNAQEIFEKIGPCIAQPKLDGFRLQVHVDNTHKTPRIHFYSRNLQDMSAMFPEFMEPIAQLPVKTLIAEGEAIGYDPEAQEFLPFQETVKRKRKHGIEAAAEKQPLKLFIFDILYCNGESLLAKGHETRRSILLQLFPIHYEKRIQAIEEFPIFSAKELEHYFMAAIQAGLEGLVVKRPDARYQPGKRNFNWIKLKRHEKGQLEDSLDLVIIGYYKGAGKRATFGIGAFLVAIYDKKRDHFETVAKVGTGLTDEEWRELKKTCDKHAVDEMPKNILCAKALIPDVWVKPAIVCEIIADEITKSPVHTAGVEKLGVGLALRFPRFKGYRPDKSPSESTTVEELITMFKHQLMEKE